jgi:hypothetical protein
METGKYMRKNKLWRKWVQVGICLWFFLISISAAVIGASTHYSYEKKMCWTDCVASRGNITVTFTYPEDGIYWNEKKILPYSVPFILHGNGKIGFAHLRFYRDTPINYTIESSVGISLVEFYMDGVLIVTVTTPPYEFAWNCQMTSFSHRNCKIVAYGPNPNDWGSDEITIYRLFV